MKGKPHYTALMRAARRRTKEHALIVRELLLASADPNVRDPSLLFPPAASPAGVQILETSISHKASDKYEIIIIKNYI